MRLAVTRNIERLSILEEEARKRQVELIALPLTRVEHILFDWPADLEFAKVDWLVFSSANAARSFFERMTELGLPLKPSVQLAAIGVKTADTLRKVCGRKVDFVPSDAYGEMMFQELVESHDLAGKTLVYPRAELVIHDPAQFLELSKINYVPIVSYRSVPQDVDRITVESLGSKDYILFTSPSNVRSYQSQFGTPKARLIAIGRSTAKSMNDAGWSGFAAMKTKNVDTVLELI